MIYRIMCILEHRKWNFYPNTIFLPPFADQNIDFLFNIKSHLFNCDIEF